MALLNKQVLILNKSWMAINTSTAKHALSLMFTGHAKGIYITNGNIQALDWNNWNEIKINDTDVVINTIRQKIKIPSVVVLSFCDKIPKQIIKFTQNNLWERDNFTCQYTGKSVTKTTGNIDHVIPKCLGGKTTWENCVIACKEVNDLKGSRTPEQAGLKLIKPPKRPRVMPVSFFIRNKENNSDWNLFLYNK
jgi:hypothetical protein